jgi:hypothetical protein
VTGFQFIKRDSPKARWPYLLAFCLTTLACGPTLLSGGPPDTSITGYVAGIAGFALALVGAQRHVRNTGYRLQWRRPLRSLVALILIIGNLVLFYQVWGMLLLIILYVSRADLRTT